MKQDLLNKTQLILKYGNEKINTKRIIFKATELKKLIIKEKNWKIGYFEYLLIIQNAWSRNFVIFFGSFSDF